MGNTDIPSWLLEIRELFSKWSRDVLNTLLKRGGSFPLPKGSPAYRLLRNCSFAGSYWKCFQQKQCGCPLWPKSGNSLLASSWSQLCFLIGTPKKLETHSVVSVDKSLNLNLCRCFSWEVSMLKRSTALSDEFNTWGKKPQLQLQMLCDKAAEWLKQWCYPSTTFSKVVNQRGKFASFKMHFWDVWFSYR